MSATEESITNTPVGLNLETAVRKSIFERFADLLCSVRFGIILLIVLILLCIAGMIIRQQNTAGFQAYFAELQPFWQIIFSLLGLFDIYRSWYFNAVLFLLSLNIIFASIDRFPKTWRLISKPNLCPTAAEVKKQPFNYSFETEEPVSVEIVVNACKKTGWRRVTVTEGEKATHIFAESGAWNRLGAYPVHVGLLLILFGGFIGSQFSFSSEIPLSPGQTNNQLKEIVFRGNQPEYTSRELPFSLTCTDIEQKLIDPKGSIESANTIDWITHLRFSDENGVSEGTVRLNQPFDYRGFRFFYSSSLPIGKARHISIEAVNSFGQTEYVTIKRDGTTALADGTLIKFADFRANFNPTKDNQNENSTVYENPAAVLEISSPAKSSETVYALREGSLGSPAVGGYRIRLLDFESAADQHTLFVQWNPGINYVYAGFTILLISIFAVFFFSHQRIWVLVGQNKNVGFRVLIGGNTNRHREGFSDRFNNFVFNLQNSYEQK